MGKRHYLDGSSEGSFWRVELPFYSFVKKHLSKEEFIKEAREMKELSKEYKVPFVINDNIEVALAVDADGVHIGQDDMSVEEARKFIRRR